MKKMLLAVAACFALAACNPAAAPPGSVSDVPVVGSVCQQISSDKFDLALKAYGAATDAVNLLIDAGALKPGSAKALAVANANDKVLSAFAVAEQARRACNATSYAAALVNVQNGIAEVRTALRR